VEFKVHYDSLMNQENLNNITQLEMQQRFEQKLQEDKLLRQKEDLIRQRRETIYLFTIITACLITVVLVMLYALQRGKLKRQHLIAEKDRLLRKSLELENEKLNLDLEYKNKELTTNVIYLAKTNEFIADVAEKLVKRRIYFTRENQKLIDELIRDLQSFSDKNTWREFELRFQEVHINFYTKLLELHPDLSANEKKLCAFLRLNMTTKEISAITYQSLNSITVARSRLRKKLGVDKEENLITYLEQL
jgi:DNA-binding CsgD family transcriptional regulator/cell division protein FtsL